MRRTTDGISDHSSESTKQTNKATSPCGHVQIPLFSPLSLCLCAQTSVSLPCPRVSLVGAFAFLSLFSPWRAFFCYCFPDHTLPCMHPSILPYLTKAHNVDHQHRAKLRVHERHFQIPFFLCYMQTAYKPISNNNQTQQKKIAMHAVSGMEKKTFHSKHNGDAAAAGVTCFDMYGAMLMEGVEGVVAMVVSLFFSCSLVFVGYFLFLLQAERGVGGERQF